MNCESVADRIPALASGSLPERDRTACLNHIASCRDCSDALRGAEALARLKGRETGHAPAGLFSTIMRAATGAHERREAKQRFWLGTGFGGALAASFFAVALVLGWFGNTDAPEIAEFRVAVNEPRQMDIAIEADRPLQGATISILLAGNVRLEGYGDRRELTWTDDLEAGINRLTLPVVALDERGGEIVVRLSHADSERLFVAKLRTHGVM